MSAARWADAVIAAQLFAVDPVGTGLLLRARAGPVRERFLAMLRAALPSGQPLKRLPLHIADSRLLGGLDLNATLRAGRPVAERGLLAEADGGVVVLAMAERLSAATTVPRNRFRPRSSCSVRRATLRPTTLRKWACVRRGRSRPGDETSTV